MGIFPIDRLAAGRTLTFSGVSDSAQGLILSDLALALSAPPDAPAVSFVMICRDGPRMALLHRALDFFAPHLSVLEFPSWDCQPYDRVSPHAAFVAQRMTALSQIAHGKERARVVLTIVNAVLLRIPSPDFFLGN